MDLCLSIQIGIDKTFVKPLELDQKGCLTQHSSLHTVQIKVHFQHNISFVLSQNLLKPGRWRIGKSFASSTLRMISHDNLCIYTILPIRRIPDKFQLLDILQHTKPINIEMLYVIQITCKKICHRPEMPKET